VEKQEENSRKMRKKRIEEVPGGTQRRFNKDEDSWGKLR
jgi:hypothetical protein